MKKFICVKYELSRTSIIFTTLAFLHLNITISPHLPGKLYRCKKTCSCLNLHIRSLIREWGGVKALSQGSVTVSKCDHGNFESHQESSSLEQSAEWAVAFGVTMLKAKNAHTGVGLLKKDSNSTNYTGRNFLKVVWHRFGLYVPWNIQKVTSGN